jgi:hypothetical protein
MGRAKAATVSVALSIALVQVICPLGVTAQQLSTTVKQVVNRNGWNIPGLSESRALGPRHPLPEGYGVKGVPLNIKMLKPTHEVRDTVLLYGSANGGQTIFVRQIRVAVRAIIKCDVNNKVFLYIVQFGALVYDPVTRSTSQSGLFGLLYYDNDGDGVFETRESGPLAVTPDLRIPDWVMKNP